MRIQDPSTFEELNVDSSLKFIVNGRVQVTDERFRCDYEIGDTNILVGQIPKSEEDVKYIASMGVSGVLNLSSEEEMEKQGINKVDQLLLFQKFGIKFSKQLPLLNVNSRSQE